MLKPGGRLIPALAALLLMTTTVQGCSRSGESSGPASGTGDDAFRRLASEVLEFSYKRDPSNATYLGIHKYDNIIRDYSVAGVKSDVEAIKAASPTTPTSSFHVPSLRPRTDSSR